MTSASSASDRRNLQAAVGNYPAGLSGGLSAMGSRSVMTSPAVGDAFADVFRMIASTQAPPPAAASDLSSEDSESSVTEAEGPEPIENQQDDAEEADAAAPALACCEQPVDAVDPAAEPVVSQPEAELQENEPTDSIAETGPDTDTTPVQEAAPQAVGPPIADPQPAPDTQPDPEATTEAKPAGKPSGPPPTAVPAEVATPAGDEEMGVTKAVQPAAAKEAAVVTNAPATSVAVEESGEPQTHADSDEQTDAPVRYAGQPEEATDRKRTASHRRHHGSRSADSQPNDVQEANRPVTTGSPPTAAAGGAIQGSKAAEVEAAAAAEASAFGEPVTAPRAMPMVAAAQAQTSSTAAASKGLQATKGLGPEPSGSARPAPPAVNGSEPAAGSEARPAGAGKEANEGPRVADRALLVQRVSRAFQRLGVDGGQVRIRLHPEELGGVQLQLSVQGQRMSARVVAETEAARSILTQHLPELRQRLADQGMQVERLEVQLEGEQDAAGSSDFFSHDRTGQGGAGQGHQAPQRGFRPRQANAGTQPEPAISGGANNRRGSRSVIQAAQQKTVDLIG